VETRRWDLEGSHWEPVLEGCGPSPFSVYFLTTVRWAAVLPYALSAMMLYLTSGPEQWLRQPWTSETSETVSQNKSFLLSATENN
jgi:hypothetical protein